jgi:hypothetical protein
VTHIRSHAITAINKYQARNNNTTKEERDAMRELRKNNDITILPAEKGQATVIIPRTEYEDKVTTILNGTSTYKQLPGDPTKKHKKKLGEYILHQVKNKGYISDQGYHRVRPTTDIAPRIVANLKTHKEGNPLRPIVAGRTSITAGISKKLTRVILPILGKTPFHITDSEDLRGKLMDMTIPNTHQMVSFDNTNMYPKIPREEAIQVIKTYLLNDPTLEERTKMPVRTIIDLLQMNLSMAYFIWRGHTMSRQQASQ